MGNDIEKTGGATVSLSALVEQIKGLRREMDAGFTRIEAHMDKAELVNQTERAEIRSAVAELKRDHENRIRQLEESKWRMAGVSAAVSFAMTAAGVLAALLALKG